MLHRYIPKDKARKATMVEHPGPEHKIPWQKIPNEVREEIKELEDYTQDTGREGSITMCKKQGKERLFVGNNFKGDKDSTLALHCHTKYGQADRIGSVHSHPVNAETVGVLFSEGDLFSTMDDSFKNKKAMIDCVTSHDTQLIPCAMPKIIPSRKKVNRYEKALDDSLYDRRTDAYFLDNVHKDFDIVLFDRKTGQREDDPKPEKVIKSAFGKSNRSLREHVKVFERGSFCEYVADLMGQHNRDDVIQECREELRRKSFLGIVDYS